MPSVIKLWFQANDRSAWLRAYIRRKMRKMTRPRVANVEADRDFDYRLRKWFGLYLLLDTTSTVDRRIFERSAWEVDQLYLIECACKHFKTIGGFSFVDIGSYWGLYAMKALHWGADASIAFEPDAKNYQHLRTHILLNEFSARITTHNLAVSSAPCSLSFRSSDTVSDGNRGAAKVVSGIEGQSTTVQAVRVDDLVSLSRKKIVMKVDVEGHEIFALQGMERLCRENIIFAQIEVWPENKQAVCVLARELGLTLLHSIEDDLYFTNEAEVGWFENARQQLDGLRS